jgi:hypothetical protein
MRRVFADFSPTVVATFAVGIAISLSVFLLPTGVVQKVPMTVLPAFGRAAGRVVADLPVAGGRASKVPKAASAHPQIVVALRPPTTEARQVHQGAQTGVVRRAPLRSAAPAAPKTPVTKSRLFSMPPTAKGKARGQARGHAPESNAATPAPHSPGRGKALGRSGERQDRLPPGQAKKLLQAPASGLPPRPKGNGGGNGRKGNGGGNGGEGNGRGNAPKSEKD